MRKYGMPERINEEVFISMAKVASHLTDDVGVPLRHERVRLGRKTCSVEMCFF